MDENVEYRRKNDIYPNYTEPTAAPSGVSTLRAALARDTGCHRRIWPFYTNVEDVSMPLSHRDAVTNCTSHAGCNIRNLSNSLSSLEFLIHSAHAEVVVLLVRRIAAGGTPVVCTIHPPSGVILDMFDHVLLLAPVGRTVYFGDTGEKSSEVFILSTITSTNESSLDWPTIWRDSPEYQALEATIPQLKSTITSREINLIPSQPSESFSQTRYALSLWVQTITVTKRNWVSVWRDGMYTSKMAKSLFVSILIAFSFFYAGSTLQGLQNQMIALLLLSWIISTFCADLQDIWFRKWATFTARDECDGRLLVLSYSVRWSVCGLLLYELCVGLYGGYVREIGYV
ncbi:uncharacterized protein BO96DRAFT_482370 [Aspergillus niger CBS 101883]|uniref:uncharacterized protein n=1 Tax=Aspergillus lacticoffeatus (strain CBS 101883) TaxID=1450533 RepID=UPI000D7EBF09|nr:uncharacterized protein BO96DRAFT_482370 [Aspergillus niger CBS 101883]PYH53247.1 hypothetical protein BO96DRAFT_482370 [Aspergillus niger CBS 101883]